MPTSEKQKAANRRNAKKSTGPLTSDGKAVASRNAIKYGLRACDIVHKSPHLDEGSIHRYHTQRLCAGWVLQWSAEVPIQARVARETHLWVRLDRQLTRAFRLLHQLQDPNRSKPTPNAPAKNFFPGNEPISDAPVEPSDPTSC